ncbi:lysine exporter LysO family protein [Pelotomaculum propionicicum]|uniref:lysine exporter LysO family protein n=1 Tax=Pelotomaculum propionicicum TaxID=258475 RepID=UPI003B7A1BCC
MIYFVVLSIGAGLILGRWVLPVELVSHLDALTTAALCLLLVGIGIDIGSKKEVWPRLCLMGWRVMLVPVLVAVGSILGSIAAGVFIGMPLKEASAIGAGFGWYSFSGVLLTKIYSLETGTLAFLSNVMREIISFIVIPVLAARFGRLAAVAPGGATTMDTTLPLIAKSTDTDTAIIAIINGTTLSAFVPFLIPLLINL